MIRFVLSALLVLLAVSYAAVASYLYQQESWARVPAKIGTVSADRLRHPEAILGLVRHAMDSGDFSNSVEAYSLRSLTEAPASYQSSFLLAVYLANRLEDRERTRLAFDTALRLFPANGRLHLSYAEWLLSPQATGPRWAPVVEPAQEGVALRQRALSHLQLASHLQEDLVPACLKLLAWSDVPPGEWERLLPDSLTAKGPLARALAESGSREEALRVLVTAIRSNADGRFLRDAARWAFEWRAPAVARESGERWLEQERAEQRTGIPFARAALVVARAHVELEEPLSAYQVFVEALRAIEGAGGSSSPAKVELLAGMAHLYHGGDEPVMAQSLLVQASALAPYDANIRLALARAYQKAGAEALSIQTYREVLRLQPANHQAAQELRALMLRSDLLTPGS